jgi:two-component sensor histidine kinase
MQGWGWTAVHHPDHLERVKVRIQESWDSGREWEDTFPLRGRDGTYRWFLSRAMPLRNDDGQVWRWFGTNTDVTEQRDNQQQIELLMRELNHRAKNMITVVQALVSRTTDRQVSESLSLRLQALSRNQDILTRRNWGGAPVGELVISQLAAVGDLIGSRVFVEGDVDFLLSPSAAEAIGLAIHELTTNATKYGALSGANGSVRIHCSATGQTDGGHFEISWVEAGGPVVAAPSSSGFGTVMIERNPRLALHANVELGFPPDGFFWRLRAPLAMVHPER